MTVGDILVNLGIFSKHIKRQNPAEVFEAARGYGLNCVQFNFETCGLPTMPDEIDDALCIGMRADLAEKKVVMAAVSGTFNMIHPDLDKRRRGLKRLAELARACPLLGTSVITLCTGTKDADYMWRRHPKNDDPDAWSDLVMSLESALATAAEHNVVLAFEPEVANIIDSAAKARRLLDEMQSNHLKIVMDGANIFHAGELSRMGDMLKEAFDLLGPDIAIAHAKDLDHDGEAGNIAAGTGLLDYDLYLSLLGNAGDLPLILHGLKEPQIADSTAFLQARL